MGTYINIMLKIGNKNTCCKRNSRKESYSEFRSNAFLRREKGFRKRM